VGGLIKLNRGLSKLESSNPGEVDLTEVRIVASHEVGHLFTHLGVMPGVPGGKDEELHVDRLGAELLFAADSDHDVQRYIDEARVLFDRSCKAGCDSSQRMRAFLMGQESIALIFNDAKQRAQFASSISNLPEGDDPELNAVIAELNRYYSGQTTVVVGPGAYDITVNTDLAGSSDEDSVVPDELAVRAVLKVKLPKRDQVSTGVRVDLTYERRFASGSPYHEFRQPNVISAARTKSRALEDSLNKLLRSKP